MLRLHQNSPRLCDGLSRREWLRIGAVGLGGLTLPRLLERRAHAETNGRGRAKSVIVLFNSGGVPHHETWDPKPDAPAEVRGAFGAIATKTPGMFVGELMPQTAQLSDKIAVIRTMVTGDNAHSTSGYQMLTGVPHVPLNRENAGPGKPNDWPAMNAIVKALRPSRGGLPSSIALPRKMANNGGQNPWPGTDGGFLGRHADPWLLECDPSAADFTVPGGELLDGMNLPRVGQRLSLLEQINDRLESSAAINNYQRYQQQAIELVAGGKARAAFNLQDEPESMHERYGRSKQAQSVLLARRLVEAGASLVQVNWANYDKSMPNSGGWDTHEKHNESLKGWLMPVMDQVYSALLTDLQDRGLLDETLVCWVAEFGHTPKFNRRAGRDHWGRVFSIALAGGGIRGGVVVGETDAQAGEPRTDAVRPCDYLATVYHCLGFEPETLVHDIEGRPLPISRGRVIESILA
ncbi:MAG: DUF1501 domain-containing protein [Pirellulaceae bacterium]